jgi:two-component system CitB family sensor kinase
VARRPSLRTLSAQLLVTQAVVLLITVGIGYGLWARDVHRRLDQQYEQRALAIAAATAAMPEVRTAVQTRNPSGIQQLAAQVRKQSGAAYVVVIDRDGIRYSHPHPDKIGLKVEEPVVALDGRNHTGIDPGSLGHSANGKAPVFGTDGKPVGEVSAGVLETTIGHEVSGQLWTLATYLIAALAVGLAIAWLLARRLKRQTLGLELPEIASLLQEREAMLYGIREGVVAVDPAGRITLANNQAHEILGTSPSDLRRPTEKLLPPGELRDGVLRPGDDLTDHFALYRGRLLVCSRRRVSAAGRALGWVITLRDRTELESALRELDETRSLTDALRAQQHEFANRMHVLSGLLDLGRYDEAIGYASDVDRATEGLAADLEAVIDDPRLVALLLAKTTVARERGVTLTVDCPGPVPALAEHGDALVSIVGNLIDNGTDAALSTRPPAGVVPAVTVRLVSDDAGLVVEVSDTGPGVPAEAVESIFTGGWTTKHDESGRQRGIGLALVRQLVERLGGSITVQQGRGAVFRVRLPAPFAPTAPANRGPQAPDSEPTGCKP